MNRSVKYYIAVVTLGGLAGLGYGIWSLPQPITVLPVIFLLLLCALAQAANVPLFSNSSVSLAFAVSFIGLLLFGPSGAVLANLGAAVVHAVYPKRRPWYKMVFNASTFVLSSAAAGVVYTALGGTWPVSDLSSAAGPAILAALAYFIVNTVIVALAVSLSTGSSFVKVYNENHRWLVVHYLMIAAICLLVPVGYQSMGWVGLIAFAVLLVLPWVSTRMYVAQARLAIVRTAELVQLKSEIERAGTGRR